MTTRTQARETRPIQQPAANMRAVAYVRVSISGPAGAGAMEAQERLFHELCRLRGWQPGRVYRETAHRDSMNSRPIFQKLMDDASQGQFDVVVVHSPDRWSRSLQVTLETAAVLSQHGVSLVSAAQQLDLSRSIKP